MSQPQHFRHLRRAAHPEGTFSFCFLWYFLAQTIYTLVNIFPFRYFKSLCLCDLSISCIRTAFLHSHCVFLFILGERTGSLLGIIFSMLLIFIFRYSHTLHIRVFHAILSHTVFLLGAYSVCVQHAFVFSVCTLCFSTPCVWRALYLEGHIYLAGHISLDAYICLEGSSLVSCFVYGLDHPDTSIPTASLMAPLIFRDQNYVSRDIHFVCVYTPCLYTRYT